MKVIIIRHGHALGQQGFKSDSERPLSKFGINEAKKTAVRIKKRINNDNFKDIYHSPRKRAIETAEIICNELNTHSKGCFNTEQVKGLNPSDNPMVWCNIIHSRDENLIIVSHLPFVDLLTQALVPMDNLDDLPVFSTATAVCLEKNSSNDYNHNSKEFRIKWAVSPDRNMDIS